MLKKDNLSVFLHSQQMDGSVSEPLQNYFLICKMPKIPIQRYVSFLSPLSARHFLGYFKEVIITLALFFFGKDMYTKLFVFSTKKVNSVTKDLIPV